MWQLFWEEGWTMDVVGGWALAGCLVVLLLMIGGPRWRPQGTLLALHMYPLKSGAPLVLTEAYCQQRGLRHRHLTDRMLVAYEEQTGRVLTSRTEPLLLGVAAAPLAGGKLLLHGRGRALFLDLGRIGGQRRVLRMKFPTTDTELLDTVDCGEEAAGWLEEQLHRPARLGYWPQGYLRDITQARAKELPVFTQLANHVTGAYSNLTSYLLLNESSVNDLKERLGPNSTVGVGNFRANLVVGGAAPYAEDKWTKLRIGEAEFCIVKPCVRCSLVTVDPTTYEKDGEMEPLKTLKTYRQLDGARERAIEGDAPRMGCYLALVTPGRVHLGDTVYLLEAGGNYQHLLNLLKRFW